MNPLSPSASQRPPLGGTPGFFNRLAYPILPIAAFLVLLGSAGSTPSWGATTEQREALIASLPRGEAFENDGQPYIWLPTLRAVKQTSGNAARNISANAVPENGGDEVNGEFLEEKGLFSIYKPAAASSAPGMKTANGMSGNFPAHPVVFNQRTKTLGALTRTLWLKLRDMRDTDGIAGEYGMDLSFSNTAMETSFYEVPEGIDLQALRTRLQGDPRIVRVTLEVIDRIYRLR